MISVYKNYFWVILLFFAMNVFGQQTKNQIALNDVVESWKFLPKSFGSILSLKDGEHFVKMDKHQNIIAYSFASGLFTDTLFSRSFIHDTSFHHFSEFQLNNTETAILFTTDEEEIYRHSFSANYWIFDLKTRKLTPLSFNGKQQLATFSPAGNKLAFVRDNNLFIKDINTLQEIQVTGDGQINAIINGKPDWVYEEEFGFTRGYEWSADGNNLAYMRFDESRVKQIAITLFEDLYPTEFTYKYPKAGETNSKVSVWVYQINSGQKMKMDIGSDTDQYIPSIKWIPGLNQLCIARMNRLQNKMELLKEDINSGKSDIFYMETNAYFFHENYANNITFLNDGKRFITISEKDGYSHLYLNYIDGHLPILLTKGNFDVDKVLGIDQTKNVIYYTSCEDSPLDRMIYSIKMDGTGKREISDKKGDNDAEFSSNFNYFVGTWSDLNTPKIVSLYQTNGKLIKVLEDNKEMVKNIRDYGFTQARFISVPSDSFLLNGYMIQPANFDSTRHYPVFMYVYGGPSSQLAKNEWEHFMPWFQFLAQQGYLVACIDNRGTDGRGEAFRKCTYLQLGKLETKDQVHAARYFGSLPYVDPSRIGIFGWSYGGFMVTSCLTKGNGVFKMGIAVAPVTNWKYYDDIYTERYMRTPLENPKGYEENSPLNFADGLQGKLLLIHGSGDDNVHFQNTMMLSERLIQADKKFDLAVYPNKNHGIYGGRTRLHLFQRMTDYILNNL